MVNSRRDFYLFDDDIQYLDRLGMCWEAVQDGGARAVILYDYLLPEPLSPSLVHLKIKIPHDYTSGAALDMFFTDKQVTGKNGRAIDRLTKSGAFDQSDWWQWSRHYPPKTKWRPNHNTLVTHLCYVQNIIHDEAKQ